MKNLNKSSDGMYHISGGAKFEKLIGSRAQVWHGTAYKTSGGLTKSHLIQNKNGRIVSKNKHIQSKKEKRLLHHGYGHKKGTFVLSRKKSRKIKGGNTEPVSTDNTDNTQNTESSPTFFSSLNNIMKSFTGGKSKKRRGGGVASNAAPVHSTGGRSRRRRIRGGIYSLGNGDIAANAVRVHDIKTSAQDMQLIATNYGGRSRRRRLRGGNVAENAAPVGNNNYMGGKKRRSKRKKMRGGIYSQGSNGVASNASNWNSKDWGMDQGDNLQQIATQYSD